MIFYKNKFITKLEDKGYASSSIEGYTRRLEHYEKWVRLDKNRKIKSDRVLAFNYFKEIRKKYSNSRTINREIQPLKLYYKLCRKSNPFEYIYVKERNTSLETNYLSKEELEDIYDSFPQETDFNIRDKIVLGFFIYQGIKSSEAKKIQTEDIDLEKFRLFVRGDKRANERFINLNIKQVILISKYLTVIRLRITRKKKNNSLLVTRGTIHSQQNILGRLSEKLRNDNKKFQSLRQVRNSLISIWVKEYDLRKAQYLSGHKYISTTEKFKVRDLSKLQKAIDNCFPI